MSDGGSLKGNSISGIYNITMKHFCFRIKYHRTSRQGCRKATELINELEAFEILSTQYEGDDFPGYENVTITWDKLKTIIDRQKKDWVNNLKIKKAFVL
jgi:hypothetical protein